MAHTSTAVESSGHPEVPRRSFFKRAVTVCLSALLGLAPLSAAVLFFIDPLTRKRRAVGMTGDAVTSDGFVKVAARDALPADGSPRSFKVVAGLQDFWNKFPNSEIGSVYLARKPDGSVSCFNARCPHLGCTVKYTAEQQQYVCPCHASAFALDGARTNQIPPRDMDPLETRVDEQGQIWVKYLKFRAGIHDRKVV